MVVLKTLLNSTELNKKSAKKYGRKLRLKSAESIVPDHSENFKQSHPVRARGYGAREFV